MPLHPLTLMNEALGMLDIDGIRFPVAKAVLSKSTKAGWDLEIIGQEQRVARINDELCAAYLQILGLRFDEVVVGGNGLSAAESEDGWDKSDGERIDATYFTLFGEGFLLWTCRAKLRNRPDGTCWLSLTGETDFPLEPTTENYPVSVETALSVVGS